jgi:hypothetical protein
MKFHHWHQHAFAGLLALFLSGCGGGSSAGGATGSAIASISINASTTSISPGQTATFSAFPKDAQGAVLSGVVLAWQSSNSAVATVADGVTTGVAQGTVSVSASAGGVTSNTVALSVTASGQAGAPANTARPTIAVTDRATYLDLAVSQGGWTNSPSSYGYGWLRNGVAVAGATLSTYSTTAADHGTSMAASVTATNGAGSTTATSAAVAVPAPTANTGDPTLGAHGIAFHVSGGSKGATLPSPAMTTQSGSTMLALVGKGSVYELSPPSDDKGNSPYVQIGPIREYTRWPGQGTAVYAFNSIVGGAGHVLRVKDSNTFDEVSFATVEVRNGGVVQDLQWIEVLSSAAQKSRSVTTTGPATLVAVWYGDDASPTPSNPVPNNGFTVVEGNSNAVSSIQMFVATKNVSAAGTYDVTWNTTPLQGAQLYLIAVQKR